MNKNGYGKEQKELLSVIIDLVLSRKIGQDIANSLIKELKENRRDKHMLAVLEMIDEENKRIFENGKKRGKREGMMETARKMLMENADIKFIARVTGLREETIKKLNKDG